MRFQVPQFVDIEDKIFGPLTLQQFFIYLGAGLLLVPAFLVFPISLFVTTALPIVGIAVAFAHVKINGFKLARVLVNAGQFLFQGQLYIWRRTPNVRPLEIHDAAWRQMLAAREEEPSLSAMARKIETEGNISEDDADDPLEQTTAA